jgi:non-ribosomal peptide synthase protein (TIGR01720 family)
VYGGEFQMIWAYSENIHDKSTIEALAAEFMAHLRSLIEQCHAQPIAYTPSDFPEASIDQEDLDNILAELGDEN